MYCVECKRATGTNNIERVVTKNKRPERENDRTQ